MAVSEDARVIWVTATIPNQSGVVLEMPAFGAGLVTTSMIAHAMSIGANGAVAQGGDIFVQDLQPEQALGPLFNGRSCDACHNTSADADFDGGMGVTPDTFVRRRSDPQRRFDPLVNHGGQSRGSIPFRELGIPCGLPTGDPPQANAFSNRSADELRGTSLIDNIRIGDIEKFASRSRSRRKAASTCLRTVASANSGGRRRPPRSSNSWAKHSATRSASPIRSRRKISSEAAERPF
jgi:hypothetical protein